jgi:hypothetical protein
MGNAVRIVLAILLVFKFSFHFIFLSIISIIEKTTDTKYTVKKRYNSIFRLITEVEISRSEIIKPTISKQRIKPINNIKEDNFILCGKIIRDKATSKQPMLINT